MSVSNQISGCPKVRSLQISSGLKNFNIAPFCTLSTLKSLQLTGNYFSDISPLQNLTGLDSLGISSSRLTSITTISKLTNLTYLSLRDCDSLTDINPISNLKNLKCISLYCPKVNDYTPLLSCWKSGDVVVFDPSTTIPSSIIAQLIQKGVKILYKK
jgi:Leucine-rich repeat (LRR) protein